MKHSLVCALGLAMALASGSSSAQAPAQVGSQVPGYFRLAVGDFEVTALFDGYNDLSPKLLKGLTQSQIRALLARRSIETPGVQTAFNAFLINTGKQLILVDTGAGQCIGATAGMLSDNMKAAGYEPSQVDTILLTHLHLDHVCGLVDGQQKPVFANATVYAAKAEADYWLDPQALAKAPEGAKPYFKIAQDSTAPYVAAGRFKTFDAGQSPVPGVEATLEADTHRAAPRTVLLRRGRASCSWAIWCITSRCSSCTRKSRSALTSTVSKRSKAAPRCSAMQPPVKPG